MIKNELFQNNSAKEGGAILYLDSRPNFISNIYEINSAKYGPNIGSYPVKAKLIELNSDMLEGPNFENGRPSSDIPIFNKIGLNFYDFDNQEVDLSDQNQ